MNLTGMSPAEAFVTRVAGAPAFLLIAHHGIPAYACGRLTRSKPWRSHRRKPGSMPPRQVEGERHFL